MMGDGEPLQWCLRCRDFGDIELHTDHWPPRAPRTNPRDRTDR